MNKIESFRYDILRILAILGVIVIHACSYILNNTSNPVGIDWWVANILNMATRWCVPVFVMMSGALLLPKQEPTFLFYRKRLTRVVIPTLFWLVLYYAWRVHYGPTEIAVYLRSIYLTANPYYHLYFLAIILGLYVVTPVLRWITRHFSPAILWLLVVGWLLVVFGYHQWMIWGTGRLPLESMKSLNFFLPYIGYFMLGYLIRSWRMSIGAMTIILVSTLGAMAYATYWLTDRFGLSAYAFSQGDYFSIGVIVWSVVIFVGMYAVAEKLWSDVRARVAQMLAGLTFGVFLIHPMIMEYSYGVMVSKFGISLGIFLIGLMILTSTILSFGLVWALKKVPVVNYFV